MYKSRIESVHSGGINWTAANKLLPIKIIVWQQAAVCRQQFFSFGRSLVVVAAGSSLLAAVWWQLADGSSPAVWWQKAPVHHLAAVWWQMAAVQLIPHKHTKETQVSYFEGKKSI